MTPHLTNVPYARRQVPDGYISMRLLHLRRSRLAQQCAKDASIGCLSLEARCVTQHSVYRQFRQQQAPQNKNENKANLPNHCW